jgi:hypothetical protein
MLEGPGQISRLHNRAYGRCEDRGPTPAMSFPPSAAPRPGAHDETAAPRVRTPAAGCSDAIWSTSAAQTPDLDPAGVGPFAAPEGSRHQDQRRPQARANSSPRLRPREPGEFTVDLGPDSPRLIVWGALSAAARDPKWATRCHPRRPESHAWTSLADAMDMQLATVNRWPIGRGREFLHVVPGGNGRLLEALCSDHLSWVPVRGCVQYKVLGHTGAVAAVPVCAVSAHALRC